MALEEADDRRAFRSFGDNLTRCQQRCWQIDNCHSHRKGSARDTHRSRLVGSAKLIRRVLAAKMTGFYDEILAKNGVYKYYVNGEWKESSSGKTVGVINPSTLKKDFQVQGARGAIARFAAHVG